MLASLIIALIIFTAVMGAVVLDKAPPSPRAWYHFGCLVLLASVGIALREDAWGFLVMFVVIIITARLGWWAHNRTQGPILRFDAAMVVRRPAEAEAEPTNVGTYLDHGERYSVLTGDSPRKFKGILFVAFGGDAPAEVEETVLTGAQIEAAKEVDRVDLPNDWKTAFLAYGY